VPLLIWKRRFVEAGAVICFVVIFNVLLPSLIWGPNLAHDVLVRHFETLKTIASLEDPSENGMERPSHRNQSLKFAIARYLQTYPPGHPLFIDENYDEVGCTERGIDLTSCQRHSLFIQFLDLPKATAKRIIIIVGAIFVLLLAWCLHPKWALADTKNDTKAMGSCMCICSYCLTTSVAPASHAGLALRIPCNSRRAYSKRSFVAPIGEPRFYFCFSLGTASRSSVKITFPDRDVVSS
jgi:hypothetical protein